MHCFDDVRAILFIVNLAGYDQVLFEDTAKNRMLEELELFEQVSTFGRARQGTRGRLGHGDGTETESQDASANAHVNKRGCGAVKTGCSPLLPSHARVPVVASPTGPRGQGQAHQ